MPRRLFASLVVLSLVPMPAFAQSLRTASERAGARLARQVSSQNTTRNPYKTPALALMGAGAGLVVLGLMQDRGAEVNASGTSVSVTEKGGSKTALTVLGAASGAAGAFLWLWGENKRSRVRPVIAVAPTGARVMATVRF